MLPQTQKGWIARFVDTSYVGDGKKGFTNTYVSKGLNRIIWEQSPAPQQINKKAKDKAQADPVKVVKIRKQRMVHYIKYREHYLEVFSYNYHSNPGLYALQYRYWYYINGGKEKVAEYNRTHYQPGTVYDSPVERAKKQARVRDNSMCQWYGCSYKSEAVHHIYSETAYPQWKSKLWNLICYCRDHHAEFHRAKGEINVAAFIRARKMRYYEVKIGHFLFFHQLIGMVYG